MLIRVVIVLLVVLNLGAGVWWALRPAPRDVAVDARVPGIALIEIVGEPVASASRSIASSTTDASTPTPAPDAAAVAFAPTQCESFGPFATTELAQAAQARIAAPRVRASLRTAAAPGRGWRVVIPPLGDAGQASALATRIGAAGITDYFVMREGADTNAIALGRYGGETAARARARTLVDAGFNARAEPLGTPTYWLDVAAADDVGLDALRSGSGAARQQPLDCTTLSDAAAG